MKSYAISPVPPSHATGSAFAGRWYTFEWDETFPYNGDYIFRGACDNLGKFYYLSATQLLYAFKFYANS